MAKAKNLKTTNSKENKDFTLKEENRAIVKFSNEVNLDVKFNTKTRKLDVVLYNTLDDLTLSGSMTLTESE